jgi:hypothetical protein
VIDLVSRSKSANVTTAAIAEAALDLLRHEVLPQIADRPTPVRERALVTARHFAAHRRFYRPVLTSSCAFAFSRGSIE